MTYAENLSENLLSLRKFTDLGLSVYLDSKQIDMYDPIWRESLLSGIYKKPYWIIEFEINKMNTYCNLDEDKVIAYVTTRNMAKLKSNEATENVATDENKKLNKNEYEKENVATDKNENLNENEYEY